MYTLRCKQKVNSYVGKCLTCLMSMTRRGWQFMKWKMESMTWHKLETCLTGWNYVLNSSSIFSCYVLVRRPSMMPSNLPRSLNMRKQRTWRKNWTSSKWDSLLGFWGWLTVSTRWDSLVSPDLQNDKTIKALIRKYCQAFNYVDSEGTHVISKDNFMKDETIKVLDYWLGENEDWEEEFESIDLTNKKGEGNVLFRVIILI